MAQAFVTTYKNHYRWNTQEKINPIYPKNVSECDSHQDSWLVVKDLQKAEEEDNDLSAAKLVVKQMQLKRLRSTYQNSYNRDKNPLGKLDKDMNTTGDESYENELIESCKHLYDKRDIAVLPPLPSSRRVYGYMRPSRMYTPMTMYQKEIGLDGFQLLKQP